MKEEVNGQSLIQTRTLWTGVDKKKERKRERERAVSLGLHGIPI